MLDNNIMNYFSKKNLLIVEDHYPTRDLLKSTFEMLFQNVYIATNGQECLEQVNYYKPDLVITDIEMPLKSGIEEIRAKNYQIPIIIISAYSDDNYLLKAANLHIQGYLLKPLDMDALENTLTKIYNLSHQHKIFKINDNVTYDYSNSLIINGENKNSLTKKENEFLNFLIKNRNKIVSYEELEYELWGKNDEIMSINSLRTLVKKLRSKLPINIIKNISKTGYKYYLE